jgi:hypothetical protein
MALFHAISLEESFMVTPLRYLGVVAGLALLAACSDAPTSTVGAPSYLTVAAAVPGPATAGAPASYPLYAGGGGDSPGTLVGHVLVSSSLVSGNLYNIVVKYDLDSGCLLETHVEVALTTGGVPQKNGNPTPGQFSSKADHACIDNFTHTFSSFNMGATDNGVVIAAHSVVSGGGAGFAGANFVSGTTMTGNVVNRRPGNQVGFTAVNTPLVAAWEPGSNTDPSYWDNAINADPSGNGAWLLTNGADWLWETFRSADPLEGTVIQANIVINVPVATTGTFRITCDNGYRIDLNGTKIAGGDGAVSAYGTQLSDAFAAIGGLNGTAGVNLKNPNVNSDGWQSVEAYPVSLLAGANTFTLYAANEFEKLGQDSFLGFPTGPAARSPGPDINGTIDNNPAGCIFGLAANAVPGGGEGEETAWGAPQGFTGATTGSDGFGGNFGGKNWATFFTYQVR